jgi:hypothetical protein
MRKKHPSHKPTEHEIEAKDAIDEHKQVYPNVDEDTRSIISYK